MSSDLYNGENMRIDYLQKILAHVRKGLTCPRCQEAFGSPEVNVLAIGKQKIELAVNCPHCGTAARISAEVATKKVVGRKRSRKEKSETEHQVSAHAHITPENIADLRRSISQLSSSDIEDLNTGKD